MPNENENDENAFAIGLSQLEPANDNNVPNAIDAIGTVYKAVSIVLGARRFVAMDDADLKFVIRRWLHDARKTANARERQIEIAEIDEEARLPPGTAARLLDDALLAEPDWSVIARTDHMIMLRYTGNVERAAG